MEIKSVSSAVNPFSEKNAKKLSPDNDIKDTVSIGSSTSDAISFLRNYKELKKEHTDVTEEPWWGEVADFCHIQGDVVAGLSSSKPLLMASTIGSGIGAIGLGILGGMEIKEGLEKNDKLKVVGGTSAILAGVASGADFVVKSVEGHELFGNSGKSIAGVAETSAKIFGLAHGTIDIGLGARQVYNGIRSKESEQIVEGSFNIGIGSTMIMTTLGIGGPMSAVALGGLFLAKVGYDHREVIVEVGKKIADKIKND